MAFAVGTRVMLKSIITDGAVDPTTGKRTVYPKADSTRYKDKIGEVEKICPVEKNEDRVRVKFEIGAIVFPVSWLQRT